MNKKRSNGKRLELMPSLNISKIKHPKGKPIEINIFDLRVEASPSYMSRVGITSDGNIGFGNDVVHEVTLFFENKDTSGWLHLGKKSSLNLFKALQKIYAVDKKGHAKSRYSMIKVTDKSARRLR